MAKQEPQIKFPEDTVEVINEKLDKFFWILFSVGFVFVVTLIVMVVTLIIDSFHINSATYKEYNDRNLITENTQNLNQELLKENQENQKIIIDLLKKIPQ